MDIITLLLLKNGAQKFMEYVFYFLNTDWDIHIIPYIIESSNEIAADQKTSSMQEATCLR